jgi:(+)-pinoresinol hydroxylase
MTPKLLLVPAVLLAVGNVQAQDKTNGEAVYDLWCAPCHAAGPRKHPGTAALEVLYKGEKPAVLIERTDLTPELVSFYVRNGVSIMPFFRKTEISDTDLADLGAFLSRE